MNADEVQADMTGEAQRKAANADNAGAIQRQRAGQAGHGDVVYQCTGCGRLYRTDYTGIHFHFPCPCGNRYRVPKPAAMFKQPIQFGVPGTKPIGHVVVQNEIAAEKENVENPWIKAERLEKELDSLSKKLDLNERDLVKSIEKADHWYKEACRLGKIGAEDDKAWSDKYTKLEAELASTKTEAAKFYAQTKEFDALLDKKTDECVDLYAEAKNLRGMHAIAMRTIEELRQRLETSEKAVVSARRETLHVQEDNRTLEKDRDSLQNRLKISEKDCESLKTRFDEAQTSRDEWFQTAQDSESSLKVAKTYVFLQFLMIIAMTIFIFLLKNQ